MNIVEVANARILKRLIRPDPIRSPGLHLSTIIGDICRRMEPERFGGPLSPERIALGLAFEDLLGPAIRAVGGGDGEHPGEFRSDGILMTPDWMAPADMLEEWKATWVSDRSGLDNPKLARYHMQAKAYVRVLGADRIRFRVLFVNGNYAPPAPALRTYVVRYTPQELRENWEMILQHAEDMGVR